MQKKISITKIGQFAGHVNSIYSILPSFQENKVYTGGADGYVVEWDLNSKGDGLMICRLPKPIYSMLVLPLSKLLLVGTASGNLHVIDLNQNAEIKNIELHSLGILDLSLLDSQIISAGGDGIIGVLDANDFKVIRMMKASEKSARVLTTNARSGEVAVGFSDHRIRIYDAKTWELKQVLHEHTNSVFALTYSPDGQYLLSGGRDVQLKRWKTGLVYQLMNDLPAHNLHINQIAFCPDGRYFITVSMDKTIKIWDSKSFELLKVIDKVRNDSHINSVNKVYWVNQTHFATVSDDKLLMFWKLNS